MIEVKIITVVETKDVECLYRDAGWWRESFSATNFIPAMVRGSYRFAGAFDHDRLVGMGRVISDGASDAYIQDVTVLGEYRGQGIGRRIVESLINEIKQNGIDWIGLIACPRTEAFYAEFGFKAMERHVPMVMEL